MINIDTYLQTPITKDKVKELKAGDNILLSGIIYTARDAAHKRIVSDLKNDRMPFELKNQVIYYAGPAPAKPGQIIGSCGPTTSLRMDNYAPMLIEKGLNGMIGKGGRSFNVIEAMKAHIAVYFAAIGGAGALLAKHITSAKVIAYEDLGAEAIFELKVYDFPLIVAIDCYGNNIYFH